VGQALSPASLVSEETGQRSPKLHDAVASRQAVDDPGPCALERRQQLAISAVPHANPNDTEGRCRPDRQTVDSIGSILGYYTLSAYGILLGELPEPIARRLPRYPLLPATLLGRLAIGSTCRGQNLGRFLLMDALHKSWRNTSKVASVGVVVEALDETARSFYLHHEFVPLQDHPNKLFLAMVTIERAFRAR
jgi:hypothetical protein